MQMLGMEDILAADLADRRKLGQGLHARFAIDGFPARSPVRQRGGRGGAGRRTSAGGPDGRQLY